MREAATYFYGSSDSGAVYVNASQLFHRWWPIWSWLRNGDFNSEAARAWSNGLERVGLAAASVVTGDDCDKGVGKIDLLVWGIVGASLAKSVLQAKTGDGHSLLIVVSS